MIIEVSVTEARNRFTDLLRAVDSGERVIITRNGKPVAQITSPPLRRPRVLVGNRKPGWDKPLGLDQF
jgi:prevent-host-death family protein